MARKPMTFDIDRSPVSVTETTVMSSSRLQKDGAARKQVGARIPVEAYRQLKSRAALDGESVQSLVEQAVAEFLSRKASQ